MARGSKETRARLIDAVGRVLTQKGFEGVGINAVAREAGVDKVLIYRYFDNIQGLVTSFCQQDGFWPTPLELMGGNREEFAQKTFSQQLSDGAVNYLRALRSRPLAREVLAWRFLVQNELTDALDAVRLSSWTEVMQLLQAPPTEAGHDILALQAIIGAAVNHLGTRSATLSEFSGIDLDDEAGWLRLESMIRTIVALVLDQKTECRR
ncbi:TetR/AcrR family transcriptional regulator [Desulfovibrio inopinatus]|uniref:TetR/AcrR family transcriptional regulator n=1 Tax=Desulfovibrio inopinatus TaxID=102109 RepID=UPI000424AAF6|nr:TetR/AcrR family transcriptional regulator [Desulfovibrio inopinatus]